MYCEREVQFRATSKRYAPEGIERRYSAMKDITIDANARTFEGYAVVWGSKNSYNEIFVKGAFSRTLAEWRAKGDLPSFYLQHDWDLLIGKWLEMREDDTGLFVRGEYLQSAWGDHALALVKAKICTGLSIGFIPDDYDVENEQDWSNRTVYMKEVTLFEVSQVERPSDPAAGVNAVRSIRPGMSRRDFEDFLHSHGATRGLARSLAGAWRPKGEARDAPSEGSEADQRDAAAMDRLYRQFVRSGDLVFDVGAHVGDRVASFRRLGARVVAVEPHDGIGSRRAGEDVTPSGASKQRHVPFARS